MPNFVVQIHHPVGQIGGFLRIHDLPFNNFGIQGLKKTEIKALVALIQLRKPKNCLLASKKCS
jgi:hypothetical protein